MLVTTIHIMFVSKIASSAKAFDSFFNEPSYLCFIVLMSIIAPNATNSTDINMAINVPSMMIIEDCAILSAVLELNTEIAPNTISEAHPKSEITRPNIPSSFLFLVFFGVGCVLVGSSTSFFTR